MSSESTWCMPGFARPCASSRTWPRGGLVTVGVPPASYYLPPGLLLTLSPVGEPLCGPGPGGEGGERRLRERLSGWLEPVRSLTGPPLQTTGPWKRIEVLTAHVGKD